jgi:1,4-dihydroxy-2-naphthoate octaprenyltransferase
MNVQQFFLCFGIGLIFAYVYTRTGRLRYSILLHGILNFFGSVIAPFFVSFLDQGALAQFEISGEITQELMKGLLIVLIYVLFILVLSIIGLVCCLLKFENRKFTNRKMNWKNEKKST